MSTARMGERGFAIPVAVLVIVVVSMLALGGVYVALSNLTANAAVHRSSLALYAAEAGSRRVLATWNATAYGAMAPGDSIDTGWQTLPGGAQYRTIVLRVDGGGVPLYRLRTIGRPAQGATAQRTILTFAGTSGASSVCCKAGLRIQGRLKAETSKNNPKVSGLDVPPIFWGALCPPAGPPLPGVSVQRSSDLQLSDGAIVLGAPPVQEDPSIADSTFANLGDLTYSQLAAMADKTFMGDTDFDDIDSRVSGGQCETSHPANWGAPQSPGHPCFDYLPIVHVTGKLHIKKKGSGQGILLVDGELQVDDAFEYYGIVIVGGKATWGKDALVVGGVMVRNGPGGTDETLITEGSRIRYSSCVVSRVLAKLSTIRPLAGRNWFEVL